MSGYFKSKNVEQSISATGYTIQIAAGEVIYTDKAREKSLGFVIKDPEDDVIAQFALDEPTMTAFMITLQNLADKQDQE